MKEVEEGEGYVADALDLLIIGDLLGNSKTPYKTIAKAAGVDQRTVAKRISAMEEARVLRHTVEVDWERLGVRASAVVGCTTSVGEKSVTRLKDFIRADPRIVEAFETVGAHQYIFRVLGSDLNQLRNGVLQDLEPLTADLTASIVSSEAKTADYFQFLRYLMETRFPRMRSSSWAPARVNEEHPQ